MRITPTTIVLAEDIDNLSDHMTPEQGERAMRELPTLTIIAHDDVDDDYDYDSLVNVGSRWITVNNRPYELTQYDEWSICVSGIRYGKMDTDENNYNTTEDIMYYDALRGYVFNHICDYIHARYGIEFHNSTRSHYYDKKMDEASEADDLRLTLIRLREQNALLMAQLDRLTA